MQQKWEYRTFFLRAHVNRAKGYSFGRNLKRNSPETMQPELNRLGEKGWELIHIEPVFPGEKNDDILIHSDGVAWSNIYFCVMKRPKQEENNESREHRPLFRNME